MSNLESDLFELAGTSRITLVLTCALAFTILAPPRAATAQDAFSCIEELSDDEVQYRIKYIEGKLQDGALWA